ncbi:MAG: molybdenum cofactor biosynthesis protein MoaE [archaeon]|nr:molybdenum cofactor biosynthesis protein MoaE [archaeon]MCP8305649.1 molybdenum cofactor biosynthesis protein MoaE [archaeon]
MLDSGIYNKGEMDMPSVDDLLSELPKDSGAIMTFIGVVKEVGKDDKKVIGLEIESYDEYANFTIKNICDEIKEKYGLSLAKIYHFKGSFKVGEPLVLVIVAGRHRKQTFPALQEAIERYKKELAVWKKEFYVDGSEEWIGG